jgi:CheY-like chemotaxis protein
VAAVTDSTCPGLVLVVDDDDDLRETLGEVLSDEGFQVRFAPNGRAALEILRDELHGDLRPCAVLLDLMMPVMSGWQFREEQRGDPLLAAIPVVVMSAGWESRHEVDCAEFIPKPIKLERMLGVLRRLCVR